jgi:hypothetical protein
LNQRKFRTLPVIEFVDVQGFDDPHGLSFPDSFTSPASNPNKFDGSRFRRSAGRPKVDEETERLVVQMAKENPTWPEQGLGCG